MVFWAVSRWLDEFLQNSGERFEIQTNGNSRTPRLMQTWQTQICGVGLSIYTPPAVEEEMNFIGLSYLVHNHYIDNALPTRQARLSRH